MTPFYNYYEDMRHKSKIKNIYIENDDDEANDDNCHDDGKFCNMIYVSAMICMYKYGIYITCQSLTNEIYVNNGDIKDL